MKKLLTITMCIMPILPACDLPEEEQTGERTADQAEIHGLVDLREAVDNGAEEDDDTLDELQSEDQAAELEPKTELNLSAMPPPPSTAWRTSTGNHRVCAQTLTVHNNGDVDVLVNQQVYYIHHFADGYNHAWGWGPHGIYGWVYNGWFC